MEADGGSSWLLDVILVLKCIGGWDRLIRVMDKQIWITDGPLEYYRVISGTTRSYPSPLGIMSIHQFRRKLNKYGKTPLWESNPSPISPKSYPTLKIPLGKSCGILGIRKVMSKGKVVIFSTFITIC
ncbi:hypothetical protein Hanom_Chr15g01396981 [Helianthus anomalus]